MVVGVVVGVAVGIAGCGAPTSGPAVRIPRELVPHSLLSPTNAGDETGPEVGVRTGPRLFFLDASQRLRAVAWHAPAVRTAVSANPPGAPGPAGPPSAAAIPGQPAPSASTGTSPQAAPASAILVDLLNGPPEAAKADGLSTGLGPSVEVTVQGVTMGTAFVSWTATPADPAPAVLPLAIGQIVLTLTSVTGIDSVRFTRDGAPADVPLPSGELSARPVTASDYTSLRAD